MTDVPATPRRAATVLLLRQADGAIEILFLRRNPKLKFQGNYWVFPGGRIDEIDFDRSAKPDMMEETAARQAAIREAYEEARIDLSQSQLFHAAHWTTPTTSPIRYATWFFIASSPTQTVTVDGSEIEDHAWLEPSEALGRQRQGTMQMAAPTFALTTRLSACANVDAALKAASTWTKARLCAEVRETDDGVVAIYQQDASHSGKPLNEPGPRHRLWMVRSGWRYEEAF